MIMMMDVMLVLVIYGNEVALFSGGEGMYHFSFHGRRVHGSRVKQKVEEAHNALLPQRRLMEISNRRVKFSLEGLILPLERI